MTKTKSCNVFGIILIVALAWANLLHILWTVWLTLEQIETGWGGGTGIEMLFLAPWLIEVLSFPVLLAEIVYLALSGRWTTARGIKIANIILFVLMMVPIGLTHLFVMY